MKQIELPIFQPLTDKNLPDHGKTVWLSDGKHIWLGCRIVTHQGWSWAESNGCLYAEDGEIVTDCELEDLDVKFICGVPKMPEL